MFKEKKFGLWATRKTLLGVLAALVMTTVVLSGCGAGKTTATDAPASSALASSAPATEAPATEKPKEIVELKAFFPGDAPPGFDSVLAATNDKLKKDNVGASLKIQFIPWNDYSNLTNVKVASAEEFDMFLDAPWQHINQMIAAGSLTALDDLVANEPELQKSIPQQMWDANKFNGKIMGIPLGTTQGIIKGFLVRKDLREKYGLPPIKTFDDMEKFLYTVKEKDPGMIPYIADGRSGDNHFDLFNKIYYTNDYDFANIANNYLVQSDKKVVPVWENPSFTTGAKEATKLYRDGIFAKNIAQEQNAVTLFNQGKAASTMYGADGVAGLKFIDTLKLSGAQLEVVIPAQADWKPLSDFKQWNFLVVPKSSKHADLVMDVMNWLSIKENHDLLEYGVSGVDWSPVGDTSIHQITKYAFPGYVMTWRPTLVRTPDNMLPDDKTWFDFARDANNFRPSLLIGFTPDLEPIKTETAKIAPLGEELLKPMGNGVLDADTGLLKLKEKEISAGGLKVQAELQKQLDTFLSAKK